MTLGEWIVIGISGFFLLWYIALNIFNRRRGVATYQWLRRGLLDVGEITDAQWLGSSSTGGRFVIANAKKPFRRFEAIYLLETRELLPYWIISHLRGRRDEIIIKASLRTSPRRTIEVSRVDTRQINEVSSREKAGENIRVVEGFMISTSEPSEDHGKENLEEFLSMAGKGLQKISLQLESPHLEVKINIKPALMIDSETFFKQLKNWL